MSPTIGQRLWYCTWDDKQGPFPATAITAGERPLLAVELPHGAVRIECTHWNVEDGTRDGWLERPDDGQVPADLFA